MKKVLKFVKGKKDDRQRVSPNTALSSSENLHSYEIALGDGIEACEGQKYFIDLSGKDKSVTKLHKAAWQGNLEKVKAVMKKGDIDIPDKLNRTALHLAAACGHNNVVHYLLVNNARTDIRDNEGKIPLLKAVECGQKECTLSILERSEDHHSVDFEGNSALHIAVKNCYYEICVLLLKKGANFEMPNKEGDTPLHLATGVEQVDIVELLLRYGSDVNVASGDMTPLMIAARLGNAELVKLFLEYGADVTMKDCNGWTAEEHAQMMSNQNVMDIFRSDDESPSRCTEKSAEIRSDDGVGKQSASKSAAEKGVKEAEKVEESPAVPMPNEGDGDNSDTWNDSQSSERPVNPKLDKNTVRAILQESDGEDECKSSQMNEEMERGQPEGGDTTDNAMEAESSSRSVRDRVDLQDSPKSCPTPPPLKPPRSWDFLQTGVVGSPGNSSSQHQNNKPRQRGLFTLPGREGSSDGSKADSFVEEVMKVSRNNSANSSSSANPSNCSFGDGKENNGIGNCLERDDIPSKAHYESSPQDPWKRRGKAARERSKEKSMEKENMASVIQERDETNPDDVGLDTEPYSMKEQEDDLVVVYSDVSDWESSSGGEGSIGSSDEVDLPMDNLPILVLPENDGDSIASNKAECSLGRRLSGKLGITEEEEDDESLSVAALSPGTSSVSERRNRFLQRSHSIDLGDEEVSTEDETAMENEEADDVNGLRKKSDGGGTEPSETASREMTTVLEVEGPRRLGKGIPSIGTLGREDTLHGYEEVWESNPQLCPRSCSRGSSSEGPHSPSTPRSPFLEVGFSGQRAFGRSRSSVGDSDHRSGDEQHSISKMSHRRKSEDCERRHKVVDNSYKGCVPKDLRMIVKRTNLSESEGEYQSASTVDISSNEIKGGAVYEKDSVQNATVNGSEEIDAQVGYPQPTAKSDMEVGSFDSVPKAYERDDVKMEVEGMDIKEEEGEFVSNDVVSSRNNVESNNIKGNECCNGRIETEMEVDTHPNVVSHKAVSQKDPQVKVSTRSPPFEDSEGEDSVFLDDDDDHKKAGAQGLVGPLGWGGVGWRVQGASPWRGGANRTLGPLPSSPRSLGEPGLEPTITVPEITKTKPYMSTARSLPSQLSHLATQKENQNVLSPPLYSPESAYNFKEAQNLSSTNSMSREASPLIFSQQEKPRKDGHVGEMSSRSNSLEKTTSKCTIPLSLPKNIERMNLDEDVDGPDNLEVPEKEDKKHKMDDNLLSPRSKYGEMLSASDQPPRTPKRKKTQRSSSLQANPHPETPDRSPNRTNPGILKRACSVGKTIVSGKIQTQQGKDFALLITTEKDRPQKPSDIKVIEIPAAPDDTSPPIVVAPQDVRGRDDGRRRDRGKGKLDRTRREDSECREDSRSRVSPGKRYDRVDSIDGKLRDLRRFSSHSRDESFSAFDVDRPAKRGPRRHKSLTSETNRSSSPLVKRSLSLSGQASMAAALGRIPQRVVQVEIMAQQQRRRKRRRAALLHPSLDRSEAVAMGGSTEEEEDRRRWEGQHRPRTKEGGGPPLRTLERRQRLEQSDDEVCPSSKESDNSMEGYKVAASEDEGSESSSEGLDSPARTRALMARSKEELADGSKREKDRIYSSRSGKGVRGHQRAPIAMREQLRASAEERGRLEGEACRLEEQLQTLTWEAEEAREGERAAAALVAALAARVTRLEADTARLAEAGSRAKLRIANREQEVMHLREVCMKYEEQKQNLAEIIRLKSIERENLERKLADKDKEEKSMKVESKSTASEELEARLNFLEQERQRLEGRNSRLEGELEHLRDELEEVRKGMWQGVSSAKAEAEVKFEASIAKDLQKLQQEVQKWKEMYEYSKKVGDEEVKVPHDEEICDEGHLEKPEEELLVVEKKDEEIQVNTYAELEAMAAAADARRPPLARGKSLPSQTRALLRDAATNTAPPPIPESAQVVAAAKAKELEITKELIREREKSRKNAHLIKKLRAEVQATKKTVEDAARMAAEAKEEEMRKKIAELQERNEMGTYSEEFGQIPIITTTSEDVTELRKQVSDLEALLRNERSSRESLQNQIGKLMEDLQSMSIANCKLKEEKNNIEQELSSALVRLEAEEDGWRREVERLGRAHQGEMERARADARTELNARLSQLNQFLQQQAQEQKRLENQRLTSEAQLMHEFDETKRKLLGEIATLQAALQVKGEEERELRQKCDRLVRENDRREEQRRKRLVERAYSVNFPPSDPLYDVNREKPAGPSVSFARNTIGGEGLPSPPSPLQAKSHIIPAPPAFLERSSKVGMTSSLSLPKPPPVVFLSPPPPGRDAMRRELDRSIRKHGRTGDLYKSLDLEHLRAMAPEKPSTDERLEILRKKYFLP
ncbi:uncharacterized protein LOC124165454 isoform X2 [Ischnura elegans]|uniref:uncharacterized protein LOC124165454 isoform X2 n=1 Tax=Ischnura elegans TaxID=197161 RepID=UPI001ED86D79|nr:uncharacterized protein LOC124165454 isoform X2 [Ischnura elegans]